MADNTGKRTTDTKQNEQNKQADQGKKPNTAQETTPKGFIPDFKDALAKRKAMLDQYKKGGTVKARTKARTKSRGKC